MEKFDDLSIDSSLAILNGQKLCSCKEVRSTPAWSPHRRQVRSGRKNLFSGRVITLDVVVERRLPSRRIFLPNANAITLFTPYIARSKNGPSEKEILLLCAGGIWRTSTHIIIAKTLPTDELAPRAHYKVDVVPQGSWFRVLSSSQQDPPLRPVPIYRPPKGNQLSDKQTACYNTDWLAVNGRFLTPDIPTLWWTKKFEELSDSIGVVEGYPEMYEQLIGAQVRWTTAAPLSWPDHTTKGEGIDVDLPDNDITPPGVSGCVVTTNPGVYETFEKYKRAYTVLFVTPEKYLYSCNFIGGIYEMQQSKVYLNDGINWNSTADIEFDYNFQWVAQHELGHCLGLGHRPSRCGIDSPLGLTPYDNEYMVADPFLQAKGSHDKINFQPTLGNDDKSRIEKLYQPTVTTTPPNC